jgi:molybdenum cofactor cytidylyltransferase
MGTPKALLRYRGRTFLDTLIGLFAARCSPVIVVLGAHADQIRQGVTSAATFVVNPDYRTGQTGSMQCGLRAVPAYAEGVLFTLADHPAVSASTLDALLAQPSSFLRVPRFEGRRGHPVWFSRALIAEFLALPAHGIARDIVHSHVDRTEYLDVADPGIVADIDDPAAYQALPGAAQ